MLHLTPSLSFTEEGVERGKIEYDGKGILILYF